MPQTYDVASLQLKEPSEVLRLLADFPEIAPLSFGDGECLIQEEASSREIFIVLKGALVVEKASEVPGAPAVILACITAEPEAIAIVGEMAHLGAQPRTASVRSSGRTHTLCLAPRHIDAILEGFPQLTRVLCRQFSQRLQDLDQALRHLQGRFALNPVQRLANPGEVLFTQGAPASSLFQVLTGTLRLDGPEGPRTVTAADLPEGFLAPGAFLTGQPWPYTATVEELTFLAVIDAAHRESLVRAYPGLVLSLLS